MSVDELVVENVEWLRRKARHYYHDRDEADDLASETIYKCLAQGKRFKTNMSFKPWAQTIMQNTYITQYNRRRCVLFCPYDGVSRMGNEYADQQAAVDHILAVVSDCERRSVNIECVMLYARGYTHAEIAKRLGIPIGTVKSRVSIGRKMLHRALGV